VVVVAGEDVGVARMELVVSQNFLNLSQVDSMSAVPNILHGWPRGTNP
jgi:hypothetical protein